MAGGITPGTAKWRAEQDAEIAIRIAREQPLSGRTLGAEELVISHPRDYHDSPELPARRIATEWDDYLGGRLGAENPSVLTRFGHGKHVWEGGDEDAWLAYQDALVDRLDAENVVLVETVHRIYPYAADGDTSTFEDVRSLYVADELRYERRPIPGVIPAEGGALVAEEHVQEGFVPRGEGWLRRWRRRRARH